jgi:hypothetical protein
LIDELARQEDCEATNSFDLEQLMATFAEDALVNDQLRDYWGKPASDYPKRRT